MIRISQGCREQFKKETFNGKSMGDFDMIISIVCPDDKEMKQISENHIIVKMWDIDETLENQFRKYEPPNEKDCLEILQKVKDFVLQRKKPTRLFVHCDAGVSRSTAITLGILWDISSIFFNYEYSYNTYIVRNILQTRKELCTSLLHNDNYTLKWFVEGRNLMKGVRPNQAILKIFRKNLEWFPW